MTAGYATGLPASAYDEAVLLLREFVAAEMQATMVSRDIWAAAREFLLRDDQRYREATC